MKFLSAAAVALSLCATLLAPASHAAAVQPHCPLVRAPVCALMPDGSRARLVNACIADWKKAKVLHEGECQAPGKEPTMCSMIYKPVCAADPAGAGGSEKTYPNLCSAETANAKLLHDGQCTSANSGH